MSGVIWQRDRRIANPKIPRREYFWGLTEEIARLGFAPVSPSEVQKIYVCLL